MIIACGCKHQHCWVAAMSWLASFVGTALEGIDEDGVLGLCRGHSADQPQFFRNDSSKPYNDLEPGHILFWE